jgi:hypothetical protein
VRISSVALVVDSANDGFTGNVLRKAGEERMKQLKNQPKRIMLILGLCILAMVAVNAKLPAQDGCPPAKCIAGTHSVCHKECDPNSPPQPVCDKICKCECVPDDNSSRMNQNKHQQKEPAVTQNNCPNRKPLPDELLTKQLWK